MGMEMRMRLQGQMLQAGTRKRPRRGQCAGAGNNGRLQGTAWRIKTSLDCLPVPVPAGSPSCPVLPIAGPQEAWKGEGGRVGVGCAVIVVGDRFAFSPSMRSGNWPEATATGPSISRAGMQAQRASREGENVVAVCETESRDCKCG